MESYLEAFTLWEVVESDEGPVQRRVNPTLAQIRQFEKDKAKRYKALSYLHSALFCEIFARVMHLKSPKAVWDYFRDEFFGSEKIRKIQAFNLIQKFEMLRMEDDENIKDFSGKMMGLVNQLRMLGREMTEEKLVSKMPISLPEKYESKVSSLEDSKGLEQLTLKEFVNALEGLEQRRDFRQKSFTESALVVKTRNEKSSSSSTRKQRRVTVVDDELWHKRYGHVNHSYLKQMVLHNLVNGLPNVSKPDKLCSTCQFGKQSRIAFPKTRSWRATQKLQLVHTDLRGLMRTLSLNEKVANTTNYLLNMTQTKSLGKKTPCEAWFGVKPTVTHLRVFRCICYAKIPDAKRTKLDEKSIIAIHLGYSEVSKGYRLLDVKTMKLLVSREYGSDENVDEEPFRGTVSLEDIYEICHIAIAEPQSYSEVAADEHWKQAMEAEMMMIRKNNTWSLVDKPKNQKIIRVKWIFRTKLNFDCSINKFKARLVVKGFSQVYGVDFLETFAPVASHDTTRLLVALVAKERWLIWHLDIKSAFPNRTISENIYVNQPEGFVEPGKEDKVCKLTKALYGLKQALRAWSVVEEIQNGGVQACVNSIGGWKQAKFMQAPTNLHLMAPKRVLNGYYFTFGSAIFSWNLKKQDIVTQSSAEAKYVLAAAATNQALWLRKIFLDLKVKLEEPIILWVDNQSTIAMAENPVMHGRTKHIRVKFHAIREAVRNKDILIRYCNTHDQVSNIFTNTLSKEKFVRTESEAWDLQN
ncbi:Reverse transcriptase [Theobroma cacao]|nr:Reverse transcriptase [Theobroma cacao]